MSGPGDGDDDGDHGDEREQVPHSRDRARRPPSLRARRYATACIAGTFALLTATARWA